MDRGFNPSQVGYKLVVFDEGFGVDAEHGFNPSQVGYKQYCKDNGLHIEYSFNPSQVGYKHATTATIAKSRLVSIPHR